MVSRATAEILLVLLRLQVVEPQNGWGGVYSPHICAVKGSNVQMECSFTYPDPATKVIKTLWFLKGQVNDHTGLDDHREFAGRVQPRCDGQRCMLTILHVMGMDANTYRFRFITDVAHGKFTVKPGIRLTVTELWVTKVNASTLMCESSCPSPFKAYIWYENGIKLDGETGRRYSGDFNRGSSYSCAVKGNEDHPSPSVCEDDKYCNKVSYTGTKRVCAPVGSSVQITSYYRHTGELVSKFWFSPELNQLWTDPPEPEDLWLTSRDDVTRRSTLNITDLRASDSAQFQFKFTTSEFDWRSSLPGVSLTVTELQVQVRKVLDVISTRVELVCQSSCRYPGQYWYIWFKNGEQVPCNKWTYETFLEPGEYVSCGLEGHDRHTSAPLYNPSSPSVELSPIGAVVEGRPVNLTCRFGPGRGFNFTWKRQTTLTKQSFAGKDLVFNPVQSTDSGLYSCSVESDFGLRTSSEVFIHVECPIEIPYVSISGLLLLLLVLAVFHLVRWVKFSRQSFEPEWRAEYHAKQKSSCRHDTTFEEVENDYTSIRSFTLEDADEER